MKVLLNVALAGVTTIGAIALSAPQASAESLTGCTYSACMQHCVPEAGFAVCHGICNRDCEPQES